MESLRVGPEPRDWDIPAGAVAVVLYNFDAMMAAAAAFDGPALLGEDSPVRVGSYVFMIPLGALQLNIVAEKDGSVGCEWIMAPQQVLEEQSPSEEPKENE